MAKKISKKPVKKAPRKATKKAAPRARKAGPKAKPEARRARPRAASPTRSATPVAGQSAEDVIAQVHGPEYGHVHEGLTDPARRAVPSDPERARAFAIEAARLCHDDHCEGVLLLDVRNLSPMADYIVIASGTSDRQMRAVQQHVEDLGKKDGHTMFRSNVDDRATWIIADFVDVVVHLFEPATRVHYDLETLWGDAPRLEWERPDQLPRDRAGLKQTSRR